MNPYLELLDDPDRLNAIEHTAECKTEPGIPWNTPTPDTPVVGSDDRPHRRGVTARG